MIGDLDQRVQAGPRPECPGDRSLLDRCRGPALDVGSGPGRLTVALAERGVPVLGIDIRPGAVAAARSAGALVMLRDVFGRVPGAGRWMTVLLADGTIGIGGDPAALLRRAGELLAPQGRALVELAPAGGRGPHRGGGPGRRAGPGRDLDRGRALVRVPDPGRVRPVSGGERPGRTAGRPGR